MTLINRDLAAEILIKLPYEEIIVKDLVCREWQAIIKSNIFWFRKYREDYSVIQYDETTPWKARYREQYRAYIYQKSETKHPIYRLNNIVNDGNITLLRRGIEQGLIQRYRSSDKNQSLVHLESPILKSVFLPQQDNMCHFLMTMVPNIYNELVTQVIKETRKQIFISKQNISIVKKMANLNNDEIYRIIGQEADVRLFEEVKELCNINLVYYGAFEKNRLLLLLLDQKYSIDHNILLGHAMMRNNLEIVRWVIDQQKADLTKVRDGMDNLTLPVMSDKCAPSPIEQENFNNYQYILRKFIASGFNNLDKIVSSCLKHESYSRFAKTVMRDYPDYISNDLFIVSVMKLKYYELDLQAFLAKRKPQNMLSYIEFLICGGYCLPGNSKSVRCTTSHLSWTVDYVCKARLINKEQFIRLICLAGQYQNKEALAMFAKYVAI